MTFAYTRKLTWKKKKFQTNPNWLICRRHRVRHRCIGKCSLKAFARNIVARHSSESPKINGSFVVITRSFFFSIFFVFLKFPAYLLPKWGLPIPTALVKRREMFESFMDREFLRDECVRAWRTRSTKTTTMMIRPWAFFSFLMLSTAKLCDIPRQCLMGPRCVLS